MRPKPPALPPGCDPDSIILTFAVPREFAGQRLDRFIQGRIPRLSRTRAKAIVKSCAYREDGTLRRASERVKAGEVVMLVRPSFDEPDVPLDFGILYEDEDLMAIDKPAGLPMHPTASYHRHTLTYQLRERYGHDAPHIAHRLDKETSGVVLCGQHLDAERSLKFAFENREVQKTYVAIVRGELKPEGVIELNMGRVREGLHLLMEVREDGAYSRTRYETLEVRAEHSFVRLHPETGRQHQLRVHLSHIGHPIVGDKLYGPEREAPFLECIETGLTESLIARLGLARQALHAETICFNHPMQSERTMHVEAEIPSDMRVLWDSFATN